MMKDLKCYSREAFDKFIKSKGWTDENLDPHESIASYDPISGIYNDDYAFICICETWRDNYKNEWNKPIFTKPHPNLYTLNIDDISPIEEKEIINARRLLGEKVIDNINEVPWHKGFWTIEKYHIFNPDEAFGLWRFIKRNAGKNFYIHCFGGASRSQAVVKFILDTFPEFYNTNSLNQNNLIDDEVYNKWVYYLLKQASKLYNY